MKPKPDARLERIRFDRLAFRISVFIVAPIVALLVSVPLLGVCAIYVALGQLGDALRSMIAAYLMILFNWQGVVPLMSAIISGDWMGLLALLPALLAWLRAAGIL